MPKSITILPYKPSQRFSAQKSLQKHLKDLCDDGMNKKIPWTSEILSSSASHKTIATALASLRTGSWTSLILIAIGGSSLGTRAVYSALQSDLKHRLKDIFFLESFDASAVHRAKEIFLKTKAGVVLVSKSGTTFESLANFYAFTELLGTKASSLKERLIAITEEGSPLWHHLAHQGYTVLAHPEDISGRFSVFTAAGTVPLKIAGADVSSWQKGARDMLKRCFVYDLKNNPAMVSARSLFLFFQKNYRVHNTFVFSEHLLDLAAWYRQLLGESIGKSHTRSGKEIFSGFLPVVSRGTTDLHSIFQYYLAGPDITVHEFLSCEDVSDSTVKRASLSLTESWLHKHVAFSAMRRAVLEGVKKTLQNYKIPFQVVFFGRTSEYAIGQYMAWKMCEIVFLAEMFEVNPYDQPHVEEYKKYARSLMEK